MRFSLQTRVGIAFGFALISIVALGAFQYRNLRQLTDDNRSVTHSQEVLRELEATRNSVNRADAYAQSYVLSGEESYLTPFRRTMQEMDTHLQTLQRLTADNRVQQERLERAKEAAEASMHAMEVEIQARQRSGLNQPELLPLESAIRQSSLSVRDALREMVSAENELLTLRREAANRSHNYTSLLILISSITAFVLLGAACSGLYMDMKERIKAEHSRTHALVALQHTKEELEKQIGEKTQAEMRLRESERSLRDLSVSLLRTQDEERRRIGRELHDSLGQCLAGLKMGLDAADTALQRPGDPQLRSQLTRKIGECSDIANQAIREVRTMSYLLHPPMLEELGLKSAISWYVEGFSKRSGIDVALDVTSEFGRLPAEVELALFRVLQESLTNVHRHSGSETALVRLRMSNNEAALEVLDQGRGLPSSSSGPNGDGTHAAANPGVGLRGMKERIGQLGGKLEMLSRADGTTVRAVVPCAEPASYARPPQGEPARAASASA